MPNQFIYETKEGHRKGFFNLYQGKNGAIYLMMGNNITQLSLSQVLDLNIDVYGLKDFEIDDFNKFYR